MRQTLAVCVVEFHASSAPLRVVASIFIEDNWTHKLSNEAHQAMSEAWLKMRRDLEPHSPRREVVLDVEEIFGLWTG